MRGLPPSWVPDAATLYSKIAPYDAIWSPSNEVIAIVDYESVVILDATTLSRLYTFAIPSQHLKDGYLRPSFSPDGRCLTQIGESELISWDLQTGGLLGAIPSGLSAAANAFSSTYSEDGKVVAAACSARGANFYSSNTFNKYDTFIRTYDLSGTEAGPHYAPKGRIIEPIWTHEKCIRFVTINPGSVAISEVEFTLKNPPVEVESLPIADKIVDGERFLFLPSLSRLAFVRKDTIQVWDAKTAKLLLKSEFPSRDPFNAFSIDPPIGSFSSDGRFFVHVDTNGAACVWKESTVGYVLHQKLPFVTSYFSIQPHLSPSGESIFLSRGLSFHLWHTRDQFPSLPSISAGDIHKNNFNLAFPPDERLAAFARRGGNVVTIFNPLIGGLQLALNINTGVVCLGMTGSALIVVGEEKIVTWDLPGGNCAFNARINDNVRTTILHHNRDPPGFGSISPDLSRIAVLTCPRHYGMDLEIYDMSTGRCLTGAEVANPPWVGFAWDGSEVWTVFNSNLDAVGWKIPEDSGSGPVRLEPRKIIVRPSGIFPWESRRGYEVTGEGWVLGATKKRLLWLPHRWRSEVLNRMWSGRFLGLLHEELSEVVILEFPE